MSWAVGYDGKWKRDIGYGVPATCDLPGCGTAIDRGLSYVCGGEPYGGEHGCGLFFCGEHLLGGTPQQCERCLEGQPPFEATPDTREWIEWKLADESWAPWRDENPEAVAGLRRVLADRELVRPPACRDGVPRVSRRAGPTRRTGLTALTSRRPAAQ